MYLDSLHKLASCYNSLNWLWLVRPLVAKHHVSWTKLSLNQPERLDTLRNLPVFLFALRHWQAHAQMYRVSFSSPEATDTVMSRYATPLTRSHFDPVTSTPSIGQLLLVTLAWQLTRGLRLGRIRHWGETHWIWSWHLPHSHAHTHAHNHARKTHCGQKNFEESAEWLEGQPDPLSDSHHQLSESTHEVFDSFFITHFFFNQIFYGLIIISDLQQKCDLFSCFFLPVSFHSLHLLLFSLQPF